MSSKCRVLRAASNKHFRSLLNRRRVGTSVCSGQRRGSVSVHWKRRRVSIVTYSKQSRVSDALYLEHRQRSTGMHALALMDAPREFLSIQRATPRKHCRTFSSVVVAWASLHSQWRRVRMGHAMGLENSLCGVFGFYIQAQPSKSGDFTKSLALFNYLQNILGHQKTSNYRKRKTLKALNLHTIRHAFFYFSAFGSVAWGWGSHSTFKRMFFSLSKCAYFFRPKYTFSGTNIEWLWCVLTN